MQGGAGVGRAVVVGVVAWMLAMSACGGELAPDVKAGRRAQGAIATLRMRLRQRLQAALAEGGPSAAVSVCATEAPMLRDVVERDTGVRLGRASLRRRNPEPSAPPWVADWIAAQGERPVAGVTGLVETHAGTVRVLEPIGVEPVCVMCHGARPGDSLPAGAVTMDPAVAAALGQHYPADAATGYAVGDLRGAFWAEADY
jgi:hypothetical protein